MGCKQSKSATANSSPSKSEYHPTNHASLSTMAPAASPDDAGPPSNGPQKEAPSESELYHFLLRGLTVASDTNNTQAQTGHFWQEASALCRSHPSLAAYVDPSTKGTPLHIACSLASAQIRTLHVAQLAIDSLLTFLDASPQAATSRDGHGHLPLDGIFSGIILAKGNNNSHSLDGQFHFRIHACQLLLDASHASSLRGNLKLYRLVEALPDDWETPLGPTVEFVRVLVEQGGATVSSSTLQETIDAKDEEYQPISHQQPPPSDDDLLSLLYRRFVRQFDQSERFFEGDNSREEVVRHRERFKNAAVNTFNIIEILLRQHKLTTGEEHELDLLVHNAVRAGSCPPDLLRYIVETNLDAVAEKDACGNLPLHYAAGYATNPPTVHQSLPESYTKYVIDELLYAYPDGAAVPNAEGFLPITLAIESGKKWIGGGVRSLYEAYPPGIDTANISEQHPIFHALSFQTDLSAPLSTVADPLEPAEDEEGTVATGVDGAGGRRRKRNHRRRINKDESHDAIMFVQRPGAPVRDIATTMWANEEDGGVQMLGCTALKRAALEVGSSVEAIASVSLMGVTSVVNAMKNHPNEPAIQEEACAALTVMAPSDGVREVSFAASGAISTVVSAMQAHVGDARVQKEACRALCGIAAKGGADLATVVASVSGFTALVNAMGAHPNDGEVQREACLAMEVLTSFEDAYLPDGLTEQTEGLLQAAAENFPKECLQPVNAIRARLVGPAET